MNRLYIDTRDNKKIIVRLKTKDGTFEEVSVANKNRAQVILPLIAKILNKAKLATADIDEINVEKGPGSYTGLRVGISIANALSFSGLTKVNGKKVGKIELPQY